MNVDVLLGLQWGDEGKGKIVDVLTPQYDIIARFQGGPNAGHTLHFNGKKYVLHTIPSGIFREGQLNIIGNGVVIDPTLFAQEIDELSTTVPDLRERLLISDKAHLILPTHKLLDIASEQSKAEQKIGSTLKGISPTYRDKIGREGLRVGDLERDFHTLYQQRKEEHLKQLRLLFDFEDNPLLQDLEKAFFEGIKVLQQFQTIKSYYFLNEAMKQGQKILAEGAQGTLLDIEFGSYPFVTSSHTVCAGACTGLGVPPKAIGNVYGIFKAYSTRVGMGPFPTELFDETGKILQQKGNEFGSTTGRERRCGWLDLISLKYSCLLNGVTHLMMTKADVLNDIQTIKVCTSYLINGKPSEQMAYDCQEVEPTYTNLRGWQYDLSRITNEKEFPKALSEYVQFIENNLSLPITLISTGPDREQTILR